jgi:hypothetical protein
MNTLLPVPVLANITYSVMPARMSGTIVVKRERAPNAALASHGSNRVRRGLSRRATPISGEWRKSEYSDQRMKHSRGRRIRSMPFMQRAESPNASVGEAKAESAHRNATRITYLAGSNPAALITSPLVGINRPAAGMTA